MKDQSMTFREMVYIDKNTDLINVLFRLMNILNVNLFLKMSNINLLYLKLEWCYYFIKFLFVLFIATSTRNV